MVQDGSIFGDEDRDTHGHQMHRHEAGGQGRRPSAHMGLSLEVGTLRLRPPCTQGVGQRLSRTLHSGSLHCCAPLFWATSPWQPYPYPAPCPRGSVTYCVAPELPPAAQQVGHGLL